MALIIALSFNCTVGKMTRCRCAAAEAEDIEQQIIDNKLAV
jgi:hypothetical protein